MRLPPSEYPKQRSESRLAVGIAAFDPPIVQGDIPGPASGERDTTAPSAAAPDRVARTLANAPGLAEATHQPIPHAGQLSTYGTFLIDAPVAVQDALIFVAG